MVSVRQEARVLAVVFVGYFGVWAACNWPGLTHAWWYLDDFGQPWPAGAIVEVGLEHGNPVGWLWYFTFSLDGGAGHSAAWNVALRFAQGGVHCLGAAVAATVLWGITRSSAAPLCLLPFLIWPFNAEAVLWRSAVYYPIAAFLGFIAVWCLEADSRPRNRIGVCTLVVAFLTSQVAALSALSLEVIVCGICLFEGRLERRRLRIIALTLLGYLIGGLISLACTHVYPSGRAALAVEPLTKLEYLVTLNRLFLSGFGYYPEWLVGVHVAVLVLPVLTLAVMTLKRRMTAPWAAWLSLGVLSLASVTPFLSLLLVRETWPAWRVMYLAPLLITSFWWLLDRSTQELSVLGRAVSLGLLGLILTSYAGMARVNSSEYSEVFRKDVHALGRLEAIASTEHVRRVVVQITRRNWHHVKYMHGNSKLTAFHKHWSACAFIRQFSTLEPSCNEAARVRCSTWCDRAEHARVTGFDGYRDGDQVCVCRRSLRARPPTSRRKAIRRDLETGAFRRAEDRSTAVDGQRGAAPVTARGGP